MKKLLLIIVLTAFACSKQDIEADKDCGCESILETITTNRYTNEIVSVEYGEHYAVECTEEGYEDVSTQIDGFYVITVRALTYCNP